MVMRKYLRVCLDQTLWVFGDFAPWQWSWEIIVYIIIIIIISYYIVVSVQYSGGVTISIRILFLNLNSLVKQKANNPTLNLSCTYNYNITF